MRTITTLYVPALLVLIAGCGRPRGHPIKGEGVTYTAGTTTMKGYLATDPERQGKRPGILVVHEWWGHNEYARTRARMLAELGYTALALDMYGNGKQAHSPDEAAAFAAAVMEDVETMKARFDAGLAYLRSHESVDRTRTGAIGYCFGGGVVLNVVRLGADLDAAVSFHGILTTGHPAQFGTVATKVLVCNGAEDPLTPGEHVEAFRKEFDDAHVDYRFIDYEGATHSWTNPASDSLARKFGLPFRYSATADSLSWADMKKFFEGVFEQ